MNTRLTIGEEVVIKSRYNSPNRGTVLRIIPDPRNIAPIYVVQPEGSNLPYYALDIKDKCKYSEGYPIRRLYKLEEQ